MFQNTHYATPILYKKDSMGNIRIWYMMLGYDNDDYAGHYTVSGMKDGKFVESGWTVTEPKNVGKKNATTAHTQAIAETKAEFEKRLDRGYFQNEADVDKVLFTKPMLAQDYTKRKDKLDVSKGVYAQPKLDGIRCIAREDGLWTRTGQPIFGVPHVWEALKSVFEEDPDAILDGELYNHELRADFNTITSVVRKAKPDEADLAKSRSLIQYHVYDLPSDLPFSKRNEALTRLVDKYCDSEIVHLVPTEYVTDDDELTNLYADWMALGYEGQMVRLDMAYQFGKRSPALLKRKEFESKEFPVAGVNEGQGNWRGYAKGFTVILEDGRLNDSGLRGNQAALQELLDANSPPDWATVRFFGRTPDGKLRFPVVTDWGWGDRKD